MILAAYYLLGGGYSLQLDSHVRMDLLYSRWSPRTQARVDTVTSLLVIFYLIMLLFGGISSTKYAIEYGQKNYLRGRRRSGQSRSSCALASS